LDKVAPASASRSLRYRRGAAGIAAGFHGRPYALRAQKPAGNVSPHVVCISSFPAICRALYFDATAPPPGEWTLIGSNPPEIGAVRGTAFRMSALSVHGKTVVVLIKSRRSNG
jgi:hypothetical protein